MIKKIAVLVFRVRDTERREARGRMPVGRFLIVLCAMVALLSLSAGGAGAFDPADLAKLKATRYCPKCDLREAPLSGAVDLSGANLSQAYLSWAYLNEADLRGAILSGAVWPDGRICKQGSVGECK